MIMWEASVVLFLACVPVLMHLSQPVPFKVTAYWCLHIQRPAVTLMKDYHLVYCAWCVGNLTAVNGKFIGYTVIRLRATEFVQILLADLVQSLLCNHLLGEIKKQCGLGEAGRWGTIIDSSPHLAACRSSSSTSWIASINDTPEPAVCLSPWGRVSWMSD